MKPLPWSYASPALIPSVWFAWFVLLRRFRLRGHTRPSSANLLTEPRVQLVPRLCCDHSAV